MMQPVKLMLAGCLMLITAMDCSDVPRVPDDAGAAVVRQLVPLALARLGADACVVNAIQPYAAPYLHSPDRNWRQSGLLEARLLRTVYDVPFEGLLPSSARSTAQRYGCAQTLAIEPIDFEQIRDHTGKSDIYAFVTVDLLCGPVCGTQYLAAFRQTPNGWHLDGTLTPSGLAF